jgi:phospholipid transport system transporter-binding protein
MPNGTPAMQLPAEATLDNAAALVAALPQQINGGSGVLRVDASALKAFDSSTIALLLKARRLAQAAGRGFEVSGAPATLAALAKLYGVDELLALSSLRADASAPSPSP